MLLRTRTAGVRPGSVLPAPPAGTMHAAPGTLTLRAEAGNEENLRRIQDLVAARVEKIGRRDHLAVNWQPAETPGAGPVAG
jgi:hypothetical protein